MATRSRRLGAVVMTALLVAGSLAPAAMAQTASPEGERGSPYAPAPAPYPYPVPPAYPYGAPAVGREPTVSDDVGAGFLNVVYVPGKAIVCGAGTIAAFGLMLITFGSAYPSAVNIFQEGCDGTWVLTGAHVSGKIPPDPVNESLLPRRPSKDTMMSP